MFGDLLVISPATTDTTNTAECDHYDERDIFAKLFAAHQMGHMTNGFSCFEHISQFKHTVLILSAVLIFSTKKFPGVDHRAPRSSPLDSEGELHFGDLIRCYECPPCILVTHRSPDAISRLKQSFARPRLRP